MYYICMYIYTHYYISTCVHIYMSACIYLKTVYFGLSCLSCLPYQPCQSCESTLSYLSYIVKSKLIWITSNPIQSCPFQSNPLSFDSSIYLSMYTKINTQKYLHTVTFNINKVNATAQQRAAVVPVMSSFRIFPIEM